MLQNSGLLHLICSMAVHDRMYPVVAAAAVAKEQAGGVVVVVVVVVAVARVGGAVVQRVWPREPAVV